MVRSRALQIRRFESMAPERLDGTFITEKSDVFAAGLIVAQLFRENTQLRI